VTGVIDVAAVDDHPIVLESVARWVMSDDGDIRVVATGLPMKSVAVRMGISEETAKQYLGRVREKYARAGRAARTKMELYHRAVEDGHIHPLAP
jgi:hypothetical protein